MLQKSNIIHFALIGYTRYSFQFRRGGPNMGCSLTHLCSLGDDLLNAQRARSTNVVIGIPGTIAPTYDIPTKNTPKSFQRCVFIVAPPRFELGVFRVKAERVANYTTGQCVVPIGGIEPPCQPYESCVLTIRLYRHL